MMKPPTFSRATEGLRFFVRLKEDYCTQVERLTDVMALPNHFRAEGLNQGQSPKFLSKLMAGQSPASHQAA